MTRLRSPVFQVLLKSSLQKQPLHLSRQMMLSKLNLNLKPNLQQIQTRSLLTKLLQIRQVVDQKARTFPTRQRWESLPTKNLNQLKRFFNMSKEKVMDGTQKFHQSASQSMSRKTRNTTSMRQNGCIVINGQECTPHNCESTKKLPRFHQHYNCLEELVLPTMDQTLCK